MVDFSFFMAYIDIFLTIMGDSFFIRFLIVSCGLFLILFEIVSNCVLTRSSITWNQIFVKSAFEFC